MNQSDHDRLLKPVGDNKYDVLDGHGNVKRSGLSKSDAAQAARSGAMGPGRVLWLNADGSTEPY